VCVSLHISLLYLFCVSFIIGQCAVNDDDDDDANKSGTNNITGNRKHLKITQKIHKQHTGKARNQETTENRHICHCTLTSKSTNVKEQ
jgi:hypothetical protein